MLLVNVNWNLSHFLLRRSSRLQLTVLCAVCGAFALGSCTVAETTPDSPNSPTPQLEMPAVRLPEIRLSNRTPEQIEALSVERQEDTVAISGIVTQKAAVLEGWLYEVQDETGSIWVLSDRTEPSVDESVIVEGVVHYEPVVVGELEAGGVYLEEKAYRLADEAE